MTVDFCLNLIWLCFGAVALCATRGSRPIGESKRFRSFRFISVVLVISALFPYVSALDDTLQLAQLGPAAGARTWTQRRASDTHQANELVWLFESMGDSVLAPAPAILPRFSYFKLVNIPDFNELGRPSPPSLGRSPPRSAPV
ncbi:MAG: hypothetical protein WBW33_25350 [Bryobacteraceae bacterium]